MAFTIVHISDLHFHAFPGNWQECASKRALGLINLFFKRQRHYPEERYQTLVKVLRKLEWDHLIISGDLTCVSLEQEFQKARQRFQPLLEDPKKATIVPGNHDRYVKAACQPDLFRKYFGEFFVESGIKTQALTPDWHLIGWDSTHPNDWITAAGTVTRETLLATESYIQAQPPGTRFILVNHYPLWFPPTQTVKPLHELYNLAYVFDWIKRQPRIAIYLHGHIHHNWSHQLPRKSEPLYLINSASSTSKLQPGQTSAFHRIHLAGSQIEIEPLLF